jgi:isoleucyl-tRNA synthetase
MPQDKVNAYMTLYTALVTICQASAPMIPFMTEDIYQNLVRNIDKEAPLSIHLCDFPEVVEEHIDKDLEASMDEVLKVVVFGRAARNTANIKNRQPIGNMYIKAGKELDSYFIDIIEDELNIKSVSFRDDVSEFTSYSFKPQLKTVGPKYGKQLNGIREYLTNVDGNAAMQQLKANGAITFNVGDVEISLTEEDLLIDIAQTEGFVSEGDNYVTVVIDTNLTPELIEEGFVREIISKIQSMRKEADFQVTDRIMVYVDNNDKIAEVFTGNADEIKDAVLADLVVLGEMKGFTKEWNINGEHVVMGVTKID